MILGFTSWKRFLICAASIIEQLWGKEGLWWSKKTFLNCNSSIPSSFSHLIRLLQKAHFYLMVCKKSLWIKQSLLFKTWEQLPDGTKVLLLFFVFLEKLFLGGAKWKAVLRIKFTLDSLAWQMCVHWKCWVSTVTPKKTQLTLYEIHYQCKMFNWFNVLNIFPSKHSVSCRWGWLKFKGWGKMTESL